jgi:hypothetical protein
VHSCNGPIRPILGGLCLHNFAIIKKKDVLDTPHLFQLCFFKSAIARPLAI